MEEDKLKEEILEFFKWFSTEIVPVDGVYQSFHSLDDLMKGTDYKKCKKLSIEDCYELYLKSKEK